GGLPVAAAYSDEFDADSAFLAQDSFVVFKSHMPGRSLRNLLAEDGLSLVLTVREPRDAIASLILRWKLGFDALFPNVEKSARTLVRLAGHRPRLLLRYEDGFAGEDDPVAALARHLNVELPPGARADLLAGLTPETVKSKIEAWRSAGLLGVGRPDLEFEPKTHWHLGHVGDRKVG